MIWYDMIWYLWICYALWLSRFWWFNFSYCSQFLKWHGLDPQKTQQFLLQIWLERTQLKKTKSGFFFTWDFFCQQKKAVTSFGQDTHITANVTAGMLISGDTHAVGKNTCDRCGPRLSPGNQCFAFAIMCPNYLRKPYGNPMESPFDGSNTADGLETILVLWREKWPPRVFVKEV